MSKRASLRPAATWGSRRGLALERSVDDFAAASQEMARRAERLTSDERTRDGAAVDEAFALVREQSKALLQAEEKMRALIAELRSAEDRASDRAHEQHRTESGEQRIDLGDELELKLAARDRFIATLAHELRSPLNTALGWTDLLRREKLDEATTYRAYRAIERSLHAQTTLVEDACDIARITAGKLEIDVGAVRFDVIVRSTVEAHLPAAVERGVVLAHEADDGVTVSGDADRLRQVVSNLLANAIKFTPQGGRIDVSCKREGTCARVVVRDTGCGIRPDLVELVFDPFKQESGGARHGLGLGLFIARELVERHEGALRVASDGPGRGSTFTIDLPLAPGGADAERNPTPRRPLESRELEGVRILLVESNAEESEWMSALLRSAGSELLTVTRAGDAFHHLPSYDPHLLMASTDALDGASLFIREIRETVRSDVPAMALTSDPSPARARSLLRAGFDLHLLRPVGGAELVRTVRDAADLRIVGAPPGRLRKFRSP